MVTLTSYLLLLGSLTLIPLASEIMDNGSVNRGQVNGSSREIAQPTVLTSILKRKILACHVFNKDVTAKQSRPPSVLRKPTDRRLFNGSQFCLYYASER